MDVNLEEMYLQNLEEYVLDEDKIVTYKWLSKTLNIHVNHSKQLLFEFCSNKSRGEKVNATYLLAGRLRCTGESHITVVGQDKYKDVKSLFESLTSEHVYSVQKAKQVPSSSILYTVDCQPIEVKEESSVSLGAIRCKESVRRAAEELALLRITVPPPSAPSSKSTSKKPSEAVPSTSKEPEKASPVKSKTEDKNGKEAAGKDSKAKGGLAAMFAAQTAKVSNKAAAAPSSSKSNSKSKKAGGISNFFNKVSKEEQTEIVQTEKQESTSEISKKDEPVDVVNDTPSSSPEQEKKNSHPGPIKKASSKAAKDNKQKRSRAKDKKNDAKKRRRILVQDSDSSDDDIFAEEDKVSSRESSPVPVLLAKELESDDEEIIPPTPTTEVKSNGRCRRRRKVTKDKTFMDNNGYMVTEKVTEYESYSESDTESSDTKKIKEPTAASSNGSNKEETSSNSGKGGKKPPAKKASPTKNRSPLKSKQQSLMNFFKKKE